MAIAQSGLDPDQSENCKKVLFRCRIVRRNMIALNLTTAEIVERFGELSFRLIEDEMLRAIARNDDAAADRWRAKLMEVNALAPVKSGRS
ncbi:hypothetical protein [Sphingomonas xinjiangensis]|uniref:Uncharacterized protein n=1 Tax=Sphingomonas xinjiangensis TaxID=643568 RepID=A0A840YF99_9SPHN|nr:hypothetical protein [Sphingomonas xinjiangensis]MBB5712127.1 hypothetical protein [Sphingomonas xinjiangensis]